jgi:hypothetical protein
MTSAEWRTELNDGRVEAFLTAAGDEAAYLMGEHILDTGNRHVPHELGDLERSGRVAGPEDGEVVVYYDTPYAVVQHEDLTLQHDAGRTAKWLENAVNGERAACLRIAQQEMQL